MIASPLYSSSWDESETLALRAALSVIDAWDGNLGDLLDVDSDSSSSDVSQPPRLIAVNPAAPYRPRSTRRKQELAALRAEVLYLQSAVALGKSLSGDGTTSIQPTACSAWEQIAGVQQQRRFAAELDNAKLRKLVQSQARYATRMLGLAKQVNQVERALTTPALPSFVNYLGPTIDPLVQLRSVDALVPRAAHIFSSRVFTRPEIKRFRSHQFVTTTPPEDGAEFVCEAMWMAPGDVSLVSNALGMQAMRPTNSDKTCMDIYQDENSLVSQFMGTSSIDDDWGVIQGQVAARILPPDLGDGSVLIVMNLEGQSFVGTQARGCATLNGWIRIEPVQYPDPVRTGPLSLIKWYRRTILQSPAAATMTKTERCKWTQAAQAGPIRSQLEQMLTLWMQTLDELLLAPKPHTLRMPLAH